MGDPKKELGEDDFDKFDAKKSEAMGVFSEGNIFISSTESFYRNITQVTLMNLRIIHLVFNEIGLNLSKLF